MYDKLVVDLPKLIGWPAFLLIAGGLLDFLVKNTSKVELVTYLSGTRPIGSWSLIIRLFNNGLVSRLFALNRPRTNFIIRSLALSLIAFSSVLVAEIYENGISINNILSLEDTKGVYFVLVLIVANFVVDIISNICAISLFRLAESARGKVDIFVVFVANLMTSITIFTLIFPLGILICLYIDAYSSETYPFRAFQTSETQNLSSAERFEDVNNTNFAHALFDLAPIKRDFPRNNDSRLMLFIVENKRSDQDKKSDLTHLLALQEISTLPFGEEIIASIKVNEIPVRSFDFWKFYPIAFQAGEAVRTDVMSSVRLIPNSIVVGALYDRIQRSILPEGVAQGRALCINGQLKNFISAAVSDYQRALDNVVDRARSACGGYLTAAVELYGGGTFDEGIRTMSSAPRTIPLTAFFLSTFSITSLYYTGVVIIAFWFFIRRFSYDVFSLGWIRKEEIPFTILSIIFFIPIELLHWLS